MRNIRALAPDRVAGTTQLARSGFVAPTDANAVVGGILADPAAASALRRLVNNEILREQGLVAVPIAQAEAGAVALAEAAELAKLAELEASLPPLPDPAGSGIGVIGGALVGVVVLGVICAAAVAVSNPRRDDR